MNYKMLDDKWFRDNLIAYRCLEHGQDVNYATCKRLRRMKWQSCPTCPQIAKMQKVFAKEYRSLKRLRKVLESRKA